MTDALDHDLFQFYPDPRDVQRTEPIVHLCAQCKRDMGHEWILGPVCGKCCRENHKKVVGK